MQNKVGLWLLLVLILLACSLLARFRCQLKYITGHMFGTPVVAFNEFSGFSDVPERFRHGQHVLIVLLPNDVHSALLKTKFTESRSWYCRESLPQMNVHFGQYTGWLDWTELLDRLDANSDSFDIAFSRNAWPRGVIFWFEDGQVVLAKEFCSLLTADELYAASFQAFCNSRHEPHKLPCFGSSSCDLPNR